MILADLEKNSKWQTLIDRVSSSQLQAVV